MIKFNSGETPRSFRAFSNKSSMKRSIRMKRLIIVSNRLPVTVEEKNGRVRFSKSVGGLATGLSSIFNRAADRWIGWSGIYASKSFGRTLGKKLTREYGCYPVPLSQKDVQLYYEGFSNDTVWPLFHYFPQFVVYDDEAWERYVKVNKLFADTVLKVAGKNDNIWIHDYHLMLLPKMIRDRLPDAKIGFFLHIPFPSFELFRLLPWRKEIIEGLLGANLIGMHAYDYVRHFLSSVKRLTGSETNLGKIYHANRVIEVDAFPMGIDYKKFHNAIHDEKVKKYGEKIHKETKGRKLIISVDRLDYSKGIRKRLEAFEYFLSKNPEYHEKVVLIMLEVPSRVKVKTYKTLKGSIDELVGRINGKFGTIGWVPVWYLYRSLPFNELVALYKQADICLVTPLRDGMNLVAKEYIACREKSGGVLILSEMAGAASELVDSFSVNPNSAYEVCEAIKAALGTSVKEQNERIRNMQGLLAESTVQRWAALFTERLERVKVRQASLQSKALDAKSTKKIVGSYRTSVNRLILLDYDGTLMPFSDKPEKAYPDEELYDVLNELISDKKNEVVLISGRKKRELEKWFGGMKMSLVAEHGVWLREAGGSWVLAKNIKQKWKDSIRPLLQFYVMRTPGTLLEEKDYSLVWHYRTADPELIVFRKNEVTETLLQYTSNLNIGIMEGNKVVEVKNLGVDKGSAAMHFISGKIYDFILAVGDDITDEDVFRTLPSNAISIKVGIGHTNAAFILPTYNEIRAMLRKLKRSGK